jgi:polygalacturonase
MSRAVGVCVAAAALAHCAHARAQPATRSGGGNAPFAAVYLPQPVPGAPRGVDPNGWKRGKLCDVTQPPYNAVGDGRTNSTAALQAAIDDCGDRGDGQGGTVLVPENAGTFITGSLWLRSNLTLRVEANATLLYPSLSVADSPSAYVRRESVMMDAHAGFINGARCLQKKDPLVGWDDCAVWGKLQDVVLEGAGTLDANGDFWWNGTAPSADSGDQRPMMLDLMCVLAEGRQGGSSKE